MLIRFCKNNSAKQGLLLFLLSICLFAKAFIETGFGELRIYLLWLLTLLEATFIAFCLQKYKLSKNSLFVALIYLLLRTVYGFGLPTAPVFPLSLAWPDFPAIAFVPMLFLLVCYYFLKMYEAEFSLPALFNGAVLWATAVLLCPTLVYTLPCIFLILLVYAANRGRIWGVAILSLALPFAAVGIWDFLNDTTLLTYWSRQIPAFLPQWPFLPDELRFYFTLAAMTVAIIGWFYLRKNPIEGEIVERKRASAIATAFLYFLLFCLLSGAMPTVSTVPILLPAAYLVGDYFTRKKETLLSEGLFLLLVVLGILSICL